MTSFCKCHGVRRRSPSLATACPWFCWLKERLLVRGRHGVEPCEDKFCAPTSRHAVAIEISSC